MRGKTKKMWGRWREKDRNREGRNWECYNENEKELKEKEKEREEDKERETENQRERQRNSKKIIPRKTKEEK